MADSISQFENRKDDHIKISLEDRSQTFNLSGLEKVHLIHEAIPDFNFEEVSLASSFFKSIQLSNPIIISSMTAGNHNGIRINSALARLSERKNMLMGVGSQRRELFDTSAAQEWVNIRRQSPGALLIGNIGITQLIESSQQQIQKLVESTQACGLFIHLNSLQECIQPEGTPQFKGAFKAIEKCVQWVKVPVVVKETGSGFSVSTLKRLKETGIYGVDVSGMGGTHWGRVEGYRSESGSLLYGVGQTFQNWGYSTVTSLMNAIEAGVSYELWASGGVRTGLDAVKLLAMGAQKIGMAQPFLKVLMKGHDASLDDNQNRRDDLALDQFIELFEYEMKTALFCTGCRNITELSTKRVWGWQKQWE